MRDHCKDNPILSWNTKAYNEIMSKQPTKPIGHNLINMKIPIFR